MIPLAAGDHPSVNNMSDLLPAGLPSGMELLSFGDPIVVLRNRWGHILYEWPQDYIPDFTDVQKICRELGY